MPNTIKAPTAHAQPDASSNSNPTATSTTNEVTGADEAGGGSGQRVATVELISQLLQKKNDPDAPKNLLAMLQENWQECSAELDEDLIKKIIKIFKLPTSAKDYRTRLETIIEFSLDKSKDERTSEKLKSLNRDKLIIYHLEVLGFLPTTVTILRPELAELIVAARDDGKEYYLKLSYTELKEKFREKATDLVFRWKEERSVSRHTLIQNLNEANGNYEDKSDDWIKKEANELQLRAEGKRLNGSAIVGANKEELKAAVIKLRNRERQVPPPVNSTLEDSMDQGGGGGDVHDEQIDLLSQQLADNVTVGTAGTVVNINVTVANTNNITNVTNNTTNNINITNTTNDAVDNLNNDSSAVDAMNNSEREEAGNA